MKLSILMQDEIWIVKGGSEIKVKDIGIRHARNIIRILDAAAANIELRYSIAELNGLSTPIPHVIGVDENGNDIIAPAHTWGGMGPQGEMACDAFDAVLEERGKDPVAWLHTLPLLRALDAKLDDQ